MKTRRTGRVLTVIFALGASVTSVAANGGGVAPSANEYRNSCAVCHGDDGRGDGNLVNFLNVKPTDLTKLTENNHGEFPFLEVFQVIDGRSMVSGHGTRDMPVWGKRYVEETGETYGPYGGEAAVRARILDLVYYIQTIQN